MKVANKRVDASKMDRTSEFYSILSVSCDVSSFRDNSHLHIIPSQFIDIARG